MLAGSFDMCTSKHVLVKSRSDYAPKSAFVPCGTCLDCRLVAQFSWLARLRLAVDNMVNVGVGCQVGFVTLTYNDEHLPRIPRELIKHGSLDKYPTFTPKCFDKNHVRGLIKSLRDWLLKTYGIKKPTYLIASEFGEHTKRPHYHGVFALPSCVDMREFYNRLRDYWTSRFGFICPKEFDGSSKRGIQPFIAQCKEHAVNYCAKYCCKDVAYYDYFKRSDFNRSYNKGLEGELKLLDYLPFHFQSRSLGHMFIEGLSDTKKRELLRDGFAFCGETKLHNLPRYFKDKLLFVNEYVFKRGKRQVIRKPTEFFIDNFDFVYQNKKAQIVEVVKRWKSVDYWRQLKVNVSCEFYKSIEQIRGLYSVDKMADFYLCYFGVPRQFCYTDLEPFEFWFNRYLDAPIDEECLLVDDMDNLDNHLVPWIDYNLLSCFFMACHFLENDILYIDKLNKLKEERYKKFVKEFHIEHYEG